MTRSRNVWAARRQPERTFSLHGDRVRRLDRQREAAGRYAFASDIALADAIALQPPELVDDEPQHFAGRRRACVRLGFEVAALLEHVEVRLRAVCQPTGRAQHLMQAVAALAAEDPDGEVHRHVIRMVARDADVADADFRLHRVRLVHDDDPARRLRRLRERRRPDVLALPVGEHAPDARERLPRLDVADDGEDRVVGPEILLVEAEHVVAGDRRERLWRAALRQSVRMETVDEPVEDRVGQERRILKLTWSDDNSCCFWRAISSCANAGCRATSDSICRARSKLSFMTIMLT